MSEMMMFSRLLRKFPVLLFGILLSPAFSQTTTTVTFDSGTPSPPSNCGDVWSENGVEMTAISISTGCTVGLFSGDLGLAPARVSLDLSPFDLVTTIVINFTDGCGIACTKAEVLINGDPVGTFENSTVGSPESFVFNNTNSVDVNEMWVQSFEGFFHDITITSVTSGGMACDPDVELRVEEDDIFVEDDGDGLILTSPMNVCWRTTVNTAGQLQASQLSGSGTVCDAYVAVLVESGDAYVEENGKGFTLKDANGFCYKVSVDDNGGIVVSNPIPSNQYVSEVAVLVEDGNIYVKEVCHGVILKSIEGFCYRFRVNDVGVLFTEAVDCP